MTEPGNILELLKRAKDGKGAACEALCELFTPLLLKRMRRNGLSKQDAEDAVQEVWIDFFKKLKTISVEQISRSFFVRMADRKSFDIRRKKEFEKTNPLPTSESELPIVQAELPSFESESPSIDPISFFDFETDIQEPDFIIAWDPEILSPDQYSRLVGIMGDLARANGGSGVRRIIDSDVGIVGAGVLQP